MAQLQYNQSYAGLAYSGSGLMEYTYDDSMGVFRGTSAYSDLYANATTGVYTTGYYLTSSRGNVGLQIENGKFIILSDGWSLVGRKGSVEQHSQSETQRLVNKMIANNKIILQNNLFCARYADKLTVAQRNQLYELQTRLTQRNQALVDQGIVSEIKEGTPEGYSDLSGYLTKFMSEQSGISGCGQGIGLVVSTTVAIVVSCVVLAALATAGYFAYKQYCEESLADVKYSKQLTATLQSKLTQEEYDQLMNETAGLLTKEKITATLKGGIGTAGIALVGLGVLLVMNLWRGGRLRG